MTMDEYLKKLKDLKDLSKEVFVGLYAVSLWKEGLRKIKFEIFRQGIGIKDSLNNI